MVRPYTIPLLSLDVYVEHKDILVGQGVHLSVKGTIVGQGDILSDKGTFVGQGDICSVEMTIGSRSLCRLGRYPKMFRNLKTDRPKVPAKFGQDWSRGLREKWSHGTTGFTDL